MAKTRTTGPKSKKHLARLEIERRQTLIVKYTAIAVVVIVLLLVGYGILDTTYLQSRKPVATVGGDTITVHELQVRTRMRREQLIQAYINYAQFSQLYGFDLSSQMSQIESQLTTPVTVGSQVLEDMIDGTLIRQEAEKRGITVSQQEIDDAIQSGFDYFPNGSPTPSLTPTPVVYSTLSAEQMAMITLTPTVEPPPTVEATATPTLDPALTPTITALPTVTPFPDPTATPYTKEGFDADYQANLDSLKKINASETDYLSLIKQDLLRKKLFDIITADVKPESEQVWAKHIIVDSEEQAKEIYQRLQDGEDFAALAAEFSQDGTATIGGDLGWNPRENWGPEFSDVVFAMKVGELSLPFQSQFGWHIVQVIGHEMRPLTADEFDQAKQNAFNAWLSDLRTQVEIVYADGWEQYVPADPDLNQVLQQYYGQ